jgi:hypothetical protein
MEAIRATACVQANQAQIYRAFREVYGSFHSPELREKVRRDPCYPEAGHSPDPRGLGIVVYARRQRSVLSDQSMMSVTAV